MWDNEAGDYDVTDDDVNEAGMLLLELEGLEPEDADLEDIGIFDEAGILEWILPAVIQAQMRKQGKSSVNIPRGKRGRKMGRRRRGRGRLARLFSSVRGVRRDVRSLRAMILEIQEKLGIMSAKIPLGSQASEIGDPRKGARLWIGAQTALGAPGASGFAAIGNTIIRPSNAVRVVSIVGYVYEDTYAAVVAAQLAIQTNVPFVLNQLNFGATNILIAEAPVIPGEVLSVQGQQYGFPIGTKRSLGLAASSPIQINGNWSPRAQAGSNTGLAVFAALCPSLAA